MGATTRETGIRALGGGVLAGRCSCSEYWLNKGSWGTASVQSALFLGGLRYSHVLAKGIGAWPSVIAVTGVAAGAAHVLVDRDS